MEPAARRAQPGGRVHGVHRRCGVALARAQHDLAGVQQLANLQQRPPVGQARRGRRELPLHARCTPQTSPRCSPKPAVPAHNSGGSSCDVRPRRFSARNDASSKARRRGWSSRHQRPCRVSSSATWAGQRQRQRQVVEPVVVVTGVDHLGAEAHGATGVTLHVGDEAQLRHVVDGVDGDGSRRRRRVDCARNRGAQARPSGRRPLSPGRPGNPEPCSGTSAIGAMTSSVPAVGAIASAATDAARSSPSVSGAPQCTTTPPPTAGSTTKLVPSPPRSTSSFNGTLTTRAREEERPASAQACGGVAGERRCPLISPCSHRA